MNLKVKTSNYTMAFKFGIYEIVVLLIFIRDTLYLFRFSLSAFSLLLFNNKQLLTVRLKFVDTLGDVNSPLLSAKLRLCRWIYVNTSLARSLNEK